MSPSRESFGERGFRWAKRLPAWAKLLVYPPLISATLAFAVLNLALLLVLLPPVFIWFFVTGVYKELRKRSRLRSRGRLIDFSEALQNAANGEGWLIVSETIKGTCGDVWYDDDEQNAATIARLPAFAERFEYDLTADGVDRRFEFYGRYVDDIEFVRNNVIDLETGTGKVVRRPTPTKIDPELIPRTKIVFCA